MKTKFISSAKKKKGEKGGKGLRHFSMKVCEKVQKKGVTSYNEVADELVAEFSDPTRIMTPTDQVNISKWMSRAISVYCDHLPVTCLSCTNHVMT